MTFPQKKTKYLLSLLAVFVIVLLSCKNKKDIDFCQMLTLDQSHVNYDTSDMKKLEADRKIILDLIKNNFKEIIDYSRNNQFPEMGELSTTGLDSCRNWAVFMTCFHIGQIAPHLYFEEGTVEVLSREMERGHLKSGKLFTSLREGFGAHEFCKDKREFMLETLELWDIDVGELPRIRFVECVE